MCVCVCSMLVVALTYCIWGALHMFGCLLHRVMRESSFLFSCERQTLCCHVCGPDAGRIFWTMAWCKRVCTACIAWLSRGLYLWITFLCVCGWVYLSVCMDKWFTTLWALYMYVHAGTHICIPVVLSMSCPLTYLCCHALCTLMQFVGMCVWHSVVCTNVHWFRLCVLVYTDP